MPTFSLRNSSNNFTGLTGADVIYASGGNDSINGGSGDHHLAGDLSNDVVNGEYGNDRLYGGFEDDVLNGGKGNDLLSGGFGDDDYYGGAGRDIFAPYSTYSNVPGYDTSFDFKRGEDKIKIAPQVGWSDDLDTNGNGRLDNGDDHVSTSGSTVVIDMAAAGFFDELDVLTVRNVGFLTQPDFAY